MLQAAQTADAAALQLIRGHPTLGPEAAVSVAPRPDLSIVRQLRERPELARVQLELHISNADEHLQRRLMACSQQSEIAIANGFLTAAGLRMSTRIILSVT